MKNSYKKLLRRDGLEKIFYLKKNVSRKNEVDKKRLLKKKINIFCKRKNWENKRNSSKFEKENLLEPILRSF